MGPLHTVNKSPFASGALDSCLAHMTEGAALLLIEDGVYAALADGATAPRLLALAVRSAVYALGPDLTARGLAQSRLVEGITIVDYAGFVDLVAAHRATHAWF